jgi:diadenylate cyclase
MRHRTAERVSRQTDALVISVSQRRETVSLYRKGARLSLQDIEVVLAKANQALQTLERYRARLDEVSNHLTALELEDLVRFGDVAVVIQRFEMLRRVSRELSRYITELGNEGRLVRMQADELTTGTDEDYQMLVRDYAQGVGPRQIAGLLGRISALTPEQLLDSAMLASVLGYTAKDMDEQQVQPKGYRLLRRIPLLPNTVITRLIDRFGTLPALLAATQQQLDDVDGVGARRARSVSDGLRRMRERSVL